MAPPTVTTFCDFIWIYVLTESSKVPKSLQIHERCAHEHIIMQIKDFSPEILSYGSKPCAD